jgi:hypothetical protein
MEHRVAMAMYKVKMKDASVNTAGIQAAIEAAAANRYEVEPFYIKYFL